jgi:hypothetical protein
MSKTKKAHRAKVAKRNQRIQNEQRQYQKVVEQIREAREFSKANGDEGGPGYRLTKDPDPVRPNGLSHFLPLTGSETHDPNKEIWIAGPSTVRGAKVNLG